MLRTRSASGLALHVLHRLFDAAALSEIDRIWLASLPSSIPSAKDKEDSLNATIDIGSGRTDKDKVRQFKLPWIIVATVDAYPSGSLQERAAGFDCLDTYLGQPEPDEEVSGEGNWVAAGFLLALRHLAGDDVLR